jgi:L-ascorbate oxidase
MNDPATACLNTTSFYTHDTIIVPPKKTVKFRTRYDRFTGDFVLHCHILPHEDLGMMQRVRISEPPAEVEERSAHK